MQSPELEVFEITQTADAHEAFLDAYLMLVRHKTKLRVFRFASAVQSVSAAAFTAILGQKESLQVLEIRHSSRRDRLFVEVVVKALPLLLRLRQLSLTCDWDASVLTALAQHCPDMESIDLSTITGPFHQFAHQAYDGALWTALRALWPARPKLRRLALTETMHNYGRSVVWRRSDDDGQPWTLAMAANDSHHSFTDDESTLAMVHSSPQPLALELIVNDMEFMLDRLLRWAATTPKVRVRSMQIRHRSAEGVMSGDAEVVLNAGHLEWLYLLATERGLQRFVMGHPTSEVRWDWGLALERSAHGWTFVANSGASVWQHVVPVAKNALWPLRVVDVHYKDVMWRAQGLKEYQQVYAALTLSTMNQLERLRLGRFNVGRPSLSTHDPTWMIPPRFEAQPFRTLTRLEIEPLVLYQRGLLGQWARVMPHLQQVSVYLHGAIDDADWLSFQHLTILRVHQYAAPTCRRTTTVTRSSSVMRNETLRRLCRQNPNLVELVLDLDDTHINEPDAVELPHLERLHLTLDAPRVTTTQVLRTRRQCPPLQRLFLYVLRGTGYTTVPQPDEVQ